jgi:preprotein translocase subunit SecD
MAGHRGRACTGRFTSVILLGAMMCGCHSTQSATPIKSTSAAPATSQSVAPAAKLRPLSVRPVQRSKVTTPDQCPATNPNAPVAPANVLTTCDLARTTLYTLGPEAIQLMLTRVDPPKPLTADYYQVNLRMDPASSSAWASFTAEHLRARIAFVRDDLVLEAPVIQEPVSSGRIVLTTPTAQAADQLAQLAGRPA